MFGQNAQHTGFNAADSISVPLELLWSRQVSSNALNPVSVANDLIFVTTQVYFNDAVLRAIQAEDGVEKWSFSFGDIFSINPPSFAYGHVYVQTGNHTPGTYLTAFDALSGGERFLRSIRWPRSSWRLKEYYGQNPAGILRRSAMTKYFPWLQVQCMFTMKTRAKRCGPLPAMAN
ncbi:MAG: PQQ-binding-like beta-propeller repeat protein [bacterium]